MTTETSSAYEIIQDGRVWYVHWTDADGRTWGSGGQFWSRDAAETYIQQSVAFNRLAELIGYDGRPGRAPYGELSRPAYEARCALVGLTPDSDTELLASDVLPHGACSVRFDGAEKYAWYILGGARRRALLNDAWRARQAAPTAPAPAERACANCSQLGPELLMSSLAGAVCPDCYDRLEEDA